MLVCRNILIILFLLSAKLEDTAVATHLVLPYGMAFPVERIDN